MLRTFTEAESRAVLGTAQAAALPAVPGLGYLRVDGDPVRLRAALSTAPERPAAPSRVAADVRPFTLLPPADQPRAGVVAGGRSDLAALVERLAGVPGVEVAHQV